MLWEHRFRLNLDCSLGRIKRIFVCLPNPNKPEPNKVSLQNFLLKKQEIYWLGPNPNKPEPNKASLQVFLLNVQEIHGLGIPEKIIIPKLILPTYVLSLKRLFGECFKVFSILI